MRLATIDLGDGPRAAVVLADGVVTVDGYADVGALLRDGAAGIEAARRAEAGEARAFEESQLRRPVQAPTAVVCVGLNYGPHIIEMGRELPSEPTLFAKLPPRAWHRRLQTPAAAVYRKPLLSPRRNELKEGGVRPRQAAPPSTSPSRASADASRIGRA